MSFCVMVSGLPVTTAVIRLSVSRTFIADITEDGSSVFAMIPISDA